MSETQPTTVPASAITPVDMPTPTAPANLSQQGGTAPSEAHNPAPAGSTPAPAPIAPGELDAHGHAFDPARHLPRKHPRGGHWLPKGGRKPGSVAKAVSVPVVSFIPSEVPAPTPDPSEAKINGLESTKNGPAVVDHSADAGEVIARATQLTAGVILDAPKETTASPAEHRHMVEATAAYIRSKGWQTAAGVGLLLMFAAWLLKVMQQPGPQAKVRGWFDGGEPRNVTPEKPVASPAPAAASAGGDVPSHVPPLAPRS